MPMGKCQHTEFEEYCCYCSQCSKHWHARMAEGDHEEIIKTEMASRVVE